MPGELKWHHSGTRCVLGAGWLERTDDNDPRGGSREEGETTEVNVVF